MSRRAAAAFLTAGMLVLTGCTEDVADTPDEPHELAPSRPPVEEPLVTVNTYPAVVNPSVVETAPVARTVTVGDPTRQVHVTYPQLGHAPLDQRVAADAAAAIAAFTTQEAPDELNSTWSVVGSGEDVVGVMSETYAVLGGSAQNSWSTVWYDAAAGAVVPNTALVDDPAELAQEVTEALGEQTSVDPAALEETLTQGAPVLAFTENGELFVGFDEFTIAPGNTGRINVVLTVDATDDLLSDFGDRAQEGLTGPGELPLPPGTTTPPEESTEEPDETSDPGSDDGDGSPGEAPSEEPVDCAAVSCVALAFDGGPSDTTDGLLDALDAAGVSATFFVVGQQVATYPAATAQLAERGHEVGVHTWSHRNLTRLPLTQLDSEITRTIEAVEEATGTAPTLLRPPYGASDHDVARRAATAGLTITPSPSPDVDAAEGTAEELAAAGLAQAAPGAVVTLPTGSAASVQAVAAVVEGLQAQGLTVVTVSELAGG